MVDRAARHVERGRDLGQRVSAAFTVTAAGPDDQLANRDHVSGGSDRNVERERLLLQLELGVEVVADQGVEEARLGAGPALHVLLSGVQVRFRHLGGDLVERGEHVVRREHDRLGRCVRMAAPGAEDRVPGDACRDAVGGEDWLDRLAASRLEDAELGDSSQLFVGRGAGVAGGGEEEVEPGLAGSCDGLSLRRDTG